jgi:transcriptional regulator with XRE-family HTH domain
MEDWVSFAERLNEAISRIDPDMRDTDISEGTGLSKMQVGRYRRGIHKEPNREAIVALANFLGVDPAWLIGAEVPMIRDDDGLEDWDGTRQGLKDEQRILLSLYGELTDEERRFLRTQIRALAEERRRGDA